MYRGSFPQTLLPLKRKEAVRRLFPDQRPAQFTPKLVFHLPSTRHMTGATPRATCHAQTVDCRRPQALRRGTLYRKTYLDPQTYLSPNYLSPNVHLKTLKAHLVEKINLHLARSAESPSVERHNAKFLTEASLADVEHSMKLQYVLPARSLLFLEVLCAEELPWTSTRGHLQQPSRQTFPFCQVRARCSGRSLGRAGSPLTFCENKRKTGKSDKVKGQEEKALTLPNSELLKPRLLVSTRTQQASFENRHVDFNRSHEELKSQSSNIRSSSLVRKLDTDWALLGKWTHVGEGETDSLYASACLTLFTRVAAFKRETSHQSHHIHSWPRASQRHARGNACVKRGRSSTQFVRGGGFPNVLSEKKRSHSWQTESQRQPHRWRTIRSACQHCTSLAQCRQLA